jgi:hypothetical protein
MYGELGYAAAYVHLFYGLSGVERYVDCSRSTGWVIKKLEAQIGQFLLGCKCPISWRIVVQEQNPTGEIPTVFFLESVLQLHLHR